MGKEKNVKYSTFENVKYVLKKIWQYDKRLFLFFSIYTILSAINPFIGIFFPKYILQEITTTKRPDVLILLLLSFFILASSISFFMAYLNGFTYPRMIKLRFAMMREMTNKCLTTDFQNTEDPTFLNDMQTANRAFNSNDKGFEGVIHKLFALFGSILALLGYITIVASLNIFVLLYLIFNVFISYYLTIKVNKYEHSKKDDISQSDRRSNYINNVMYDFSYGKEIRIFNLSNYLSNMFVKFKNTRLNVHKKIVKKQFTIGLIDVLLLLIREGIIYAYLIYLTINGRLDIPNFLMYFATIVNFANSLKNLINDFAYLKTQNLYLCDMRTFLEKKDILKSDNEIDLPKPPYQIEFKNVSFKYPRSEKYIFKNVSLKIPFGQKLAIVGHNGAGKTTFIKLLCRLYDVDDGEILLNGINIKNFSKEDYYKIFSTVFQEIKTTAFSIAENIAMKQKGQIDYNKINSSIKQIGLDEKINSLKFGIETSMQKILDKDGVELSGGEKQKISIARALYKAGNIMILDEPTAALDALAEYNIYKSFNQMVNNKTAIYISHRLASTHFCNKIAMFENGQIVEYGTHDELIALNGKYADMFNIQAKYYKESEAI